MQAGSSRDTDRQADGQRKRGGTVAPLSSPAQRAAGSTCPPAHLQYRLLPLGVPLHPGMQPADPPVWHLHKAAAVCGAALVPRAAGVPAAAAALPGPARTAVPAGAGAHGCKGAGAVWWAASQAARRQAAAEGAAKRDRGGAVRRGGTGQGSRQLRQALQVHIPAPPQRHAPALQQHKGQLGAGGWAQPAPHLRAARLAGQRAQLAQRGRVAAAQHLERCRCSRRVAIHSGSGRHGGGCHRAPPLAAVPVVHASRAGGSGGRHGGRRAVLAVGLILVAAPSSCCPLFANSAQLLAALLARARSRGYGKPCSTVLLVSPCRRWTPVPGRHGEPRPTLFVHTEWTTVIAQTWGVIGACCRLDNKRESVERKCRSHGAAGGCLCLCSPARHSWHTLTWRAALSLPNSLCALFRERSNDLLTAAGREAPA